MGFAELWSFESSRIPRAGLLITVRSAATPASTFVLDGGDGTNLTFALNIPSNSDDLYFHMSGPAGNDWMAVGAGNLMKDSLMFIVYTAANGRNVTVSPRIGTGHSEPTYTTDVSVFLLPGSGLINDTYIINAKCHGCRKWKGGFLDLKSKTQPMTMLLDLATTFKAICWTPAFGVMKISVSLESRLCCSS